MHTFCKGIAVCEMQTALSRIWTQVTMSVSYHDNHYTIGTSLWSSNIPFLNANFILMLYTKFYFYCLYLFILNWKKRNFKQLYFRSNKMEHKAVKTAQYQTSISSGNQQHCFQKFPDEDQGLENKEHYRYPAISDNKFRTIIEGKPCKMINWMI